MQNSSTELSASIVDSNINTEEIDSNGETIVNSIFPFRTFYDNVLENSYESSEDDENDNDSFVDQSDESIFVNDNCQISQTYVSDKSKTKINNINEDITKIPVKPSDIPKNNYIKYVDDIINSYYKISYEPYMNIDTYSSNKIKPIPNEDGIYFINSTYDTYKSRSLRSSLKETKSTYVNLTYRVCLAQNQHQEFLNSEIQDVCYLDAKNIRGEKYITIQAESLWKLEFVPDVLIFDECSSFLRQMFSGLHGSHLHENRIKLEFLIKNVSKIICMDADIDNDFIDLVHTYRPNDKINIQINTYTHQPKTFYECPDKVTMMHQLLSKLEYNKHIGIVCGTVAMIEFIRSIIIKHFQEKGLPGKKGRVFSSEHKEHDIDEILNPNDHWDKFDYMIYTSIIGAGIDFHKEHFDTMFIFANDNVCLVSDYFQMLNRIRNVKDQEVYYHLKTKKYKFTATKKAVEDKIYETLNGQDNSLITVVKDFVINKQVVLNSETKLMSWVPTRDIWYDTFIKLRVKEGQNKKYFTKLFEHKIKQIGSSIIRLNSVIKTNEELAMYNAEFTQIKTEILNNRINIFDEVEIKDKNTLKNDNITEMDIFGVKKGICHNLVVYPTGEECIYIEKNNHKLLNIRLERDLSSIQLHHRDLINRKYDPHYIPITVKVELIRDLNKLLGFNNSWDTSNTIDSIFIMENDDYFLENLPKYRAYFNVDTCELITWKDYSGMLHSIYYNWSGSLFKTKRKRKQIKGNRVDWYECYLEHPNISLINKLTIHPDKHKIIPPDKIIKESMVNNNLSNNKKIISPNKSKKPKLKIITEDKGYSNNNNLANI